MTHPTYPGTTHQVAQQNSQPCGCGQQVFAVTTTGDAALIRAGIVDDEALRAFTTGQCHAFALAMHEATGWPIIAAAEPDHEWMTFEEILPAAPVGSDGARHMRGAYLSTYATHLFVQHPSGDLVDIRGRTTAEAWMAHAGLDGAPHDPRWYPSPDGNPVDDAEAYANRVSGEIGSFCLFVGATAEDTRNVYADRRTMALDAARTLVPTVLASLEEAPAGHDLESEPGHVICDVCTLTYPAAFEDRCPNAWRGTKDKTKDTRYQLPTEQHEAARAHIEQYRTAQAATSS